MKDHSNHQQNRCMVALFFDSGGLGTPSYGEKVFEYIVKGDELKDNNFKVVVSVGDVFNSDIYDDITPFRIMDELCTIEKTDKRCKDYIFAVMLEDVSIVNAKKIDERIKKECPAYLGMTSIDIDSADERKQFWKMLVRCYSIEGETLTCFGYEEEGFGYYKKALEYGFRVNYDGFPDEEDCDDQEYLFSTRQSGFITKVEQLELKEGRNDSDRGISEMNYALVKEVEIAGVQIWKAIEDINRAYIPKKGKNTVVDYLFTSLYQTSQGIERLFKILIELMYYENTSYDRQKIDELLLSHNHEGMYQFINGQINLKFGKNERKIVELMSRFYNEARYNRFSYSKDDIMELSLLQEFGSDIKEDNFDKDIKHRYGKSIGGISHKLYKAISDMSLKLNIYVYELNYNSVASFALSDYYRDDLYGILKEIENCKRELLWYLIKKGKDLKISEIGEEIDALPFDVMGLDSFLEELIYNKDSGSLIYDFVSEEYDEMVKEDKEKWKKRLEFIDIIGNTNYCFFEDECYDKEISDFQDRS